MINAGILINVDWLKKHEDTGLEVNYLFPISELLRQARLFFPFL